MEQISLSTTGIRVSRIAIGTWSFGGDSSSYWGNQEQSAVNDLVSHALDIGANFFDTAIRYNDGKSEESLGLALKGKRESAVICSKLPVQTPESLKHGKQIVLDSIKRLQTDYIDIMMMHWPVKNPGLMSAHLGLLKEMQAEGYIRAIGASNFGTGAMAFTEKEGVVLAMNEIPYNLITRGAEYSILPYARTHNIPVAAYMPLMQGILGGKYSSIADIPAVRRRTIHFDQAGNPAIRHGGSGHEKALEKFLNDFSKLSVDTGIDMRTLSIAWLQQRSGLEITLVGCRNVEQLDENIAAMDVVLDKDVMAALDAISEQLKVEMGENIDLWQSGENTRIS